MLRIVDMEPNANRRRFVGDDEALVVALRMGDRAAQRELYARYSNHISRVLGRVLGADAELADLHHDVFVRALRSMSKLRDGTALKAWLTTIAVRVARTAITKRQRYRWLRFLPHHKVPEIEVEATSEEARQALRLTYLVLDELPIVERIVFSLRYIDGMELKEVAHVCGASLATVKRRLARAGKRFVAKAKRHPVLNEWLAEGIRWRSPIDN